MHDNAILRALDSGPKHKSELADIIGLDGLRTMGVLHKMRERGLIVICFDGRYEIGSRGYA